MRADRRLLRHDARSLSRRIGRGRTIRDVAAYSAEIVDGGPSPAMTMYAWPSLTMYAWLPLTIYAWLSLPMKRLFAREPLAQASGGTAQDDGFGAAPLGGGVGGAQGAASRIMRLA